MAEQVKEEKTGQKVRHTIVTPVYIGQFATEVDAITGFERPMMKAMRQVYDLKGRLLRIEYKSDNGDWLLHTEVRKNGQDG